MQLFLFFVLFLLSFYYSSCNLFDFNMDGMIFAVEKK